MSENTEYTAFIQFFKFLLDKNYKIVERRVYDSYRNTILDDILVAIIWFQRIMPLVLTLGLNHVCIVIYHNIKTVVMINFFCIKCQHHVYLLCWCHVQYYTRHDTLSTSFCSQFEPSRYVSF